MVLSIYHIMTYLYFYISIICKIISLFLILTSVIGVFRFKDFASKIHSQSITDSIAIFLFIVGFCFEFLSVHLFFKLLLFTIFYWIASAANSYIIFGLLYRKKIK